MLYRLHLRCDGEMFPDAQGMDLPDLEAACFHATKIAQDIMGEEARNGRLPLTWSIEMEDEFWRDRCRNSVPGRDDCSLANLQRNRC